MIRRKDEVFMEEYNESIKFSQIAVVTRSGGERQPMYYTHSTYSLRSSI